MTTMTAKERREQERKEYEKKQNTKKVFMGVITLVVLFTFMAPFFIGFF